MASIREWCISLLMGGALGVAGTTVVTNNAAPVAAVKKAPVKKRSPVAKKSALPAGLPTSNLLADCPIVSPFSPVGVPPLGGVSTGGQQLLGPVYPFESLPVYGWESSLTPSGPKVPGIPEPATWAMFIIGFGLVGMSLRKKQVLTSA